jgi:SAM-dependent methyltransferase
MNALSPIQWHDRFVHQARWTAQLRTFISQQVNLSKSQSILEVGSGTGVVLANTFVSKSAFRLGLDLRFDFLEFSKSKFPNQTYLNADGYHLPLSDGSISITICHFLLLWINNPITVLSEMRRVTQPGGVVVALAEPDYGGRIDHPAELVRLGQLQADSLFDQGADPYMGRKIHGLFHRAGFVNIQSGILGGHWGEPPSDEAWDSEWTTLEQDLGATVSPETIHTLRELDAASWQKGERILFVPTFYAWGFVPD